MVLRIFTALFAASFLFGAAGSANAAEQLSNPGKAALEFKASSDSKKDFRPKKRKKSKPKKRHCDAY